MQDREKTRNSKVSQKEQIGWQANVQQKYCKTSMTMHGVRWFCEYRNINKMQNKQCSASARLVLLHHLLFLNRFASPTCSQKSVRNNIEPCPWWQSWKSWSGLRSCGCRDIGGFRHLQPILFWLNSQGWSLGQTLEPQNHAESLEMKFAAAKSQNHKITSPPRVIFSPWFSHIFSLEMALGNF